MLDMDKTGIKVRGVLKSRMVTSRVRDLILSGEFASGYRLPPERVLAKQLNVNHLTVRRGLENLVTEGLIQKRPRVGNFVSESLPATQISIVLPEWLHEGHRPTMSLVLQGVNRVLDQRKYSISTLFYRTDRLWSDVGRILVDREVSGILLRPGADVTLEDMQRLLDAGIQVVMISSAPQLASLGLVLVNIDLGIALAQTVDKLVELGHRQIVYTGYLENPSRRQHEVIWRECCNQNGIGGALLENVIHIPNHGGKSNYTVLEALFTQTPMPTAVILPDEFAACEVFRMCHKRDVRVPRDLSISVLTDLTPHVHPISLSAPDSAMLNTQVAEAAAKYLVKLLKGEDVSESEISFRGDMQWKASVAPPPPETGR